MIFRLFVFFCWNDLSQKNTNQEYTRCLLLQSLFYHHHPQVTMGSPVLSAKEGMKINNQTKMKIRVGSVVKAKVGELDKITREGRSRRMRKEVEGCVQNVVGNNNFLVLFEDGQKKDIGSCLLVYLSEKEEVEMEESITLFPQKRVRHTVDYYGDTTDGEPCMFVNGIYLSVFYCLCYDTDIYTYILEDQVAEERDPDLN